jgi:hypothetical protein
LNWMNTSPKSNLYSFGIKQIIKIRILVLVYLWAVRYIFSHGFQGFNIFTHLTWQERIILYKKVIQLKRQSVMVEIGSYLGASSFFLAAGASDSNTNSLVFCVDTWMNDGMSEGKRDTWNEFHINTSNFSKFIVPCRGSSAEIAQTFNRDIDLLFIDGDHSFEGCKKDVESWLPHVRSGGIIIFHDYGWAEGVKMVTNHLIAHKILIKETVFRNILWARKV